MKRKLFYTAVLFVVTLAVVGCYYGPARGSQRITLNISSILSPKALDPVEETHVWVYFYYDPDGANSLEDIKQDDINAEGEVSFDGIPVGDWRLLIAVGKPNGAGGFIVSRYVEKPATVSTNSTYTVEIAASEVVENPFSLLVEGKNITGIELTAGGDLYASTESEIYLFNEITDDFNTTPEDTLSSGITINSLSSGVFHDAGGVETNGFLINSSRGIIPYDPDTGASEDFSSSLGNGNTDVILSGSYDAESNLVYYYTAPGEIGGVFVPETAEDRLQPESWIEIDLNDIPGIQSNEPVLDLLITTKYGYFATQFGAFRLDEDSLEEGTLGPDQLLSAAVFFGEDETGAALVQSLAYESVENDLYFGAENGAYVGTLTESVADTAVSGISVIADTEGVNIHLAAVNTGGDCAAFLSTEELFVLINDGGSATVQRYPFLFDQIGTLSALEFDGDQLYVGGSLGVATTDCSTLD